MDLSLVSIFDGSHFTDSQRELIVQGVSEPFQAEVSIILPDRD